MESISAALDTVSGLLFAGALAMIAFTHKELKAARLMLVLAAVLLMARWTVWAMLTQTPWWVRAIVGAVIGGAILSGLPALWHWSQERSASAPVSGKTADAPPQPALPSSPRINILYHGKEPIIGGESLVWFNNNVRFDKDAGPDWPEWLFYSMFYIQNVYITNASDKRMTVIIELAVTLGKWHRTLVGDGKDKLGRVIGKDDFYAKVTHNLAGREIQRYLLSPVMLTPGETAHGDLVFIVGGMGGPTPKELSKWAHEEPSTYRLILTDVVSGYTREIQLNSPPYGPLPPAPSPEADIIKPP